MKVFFVRGSKFTNKVMVDSTGLSHKNFKRTFKRNLWESSNLENNFKNNLALRNLVMKNLVHTDY